MTIFVDKSAMSYMQASPQSSISHQLQACLLGAACLLGFARLAWISFWAAVIMPSVALSHWPDNSHWR